MSGYIVIWRIHGVIRRRGCYWRRRRCWSRRLFSGMRARILGINTFDISYRIADNCMQCTECRKSHVRGVNGNTRRRRGTSGGSNDFASELRKYGGRDGGGKNERGPLRSTCVARPVQRGSQSAESDSGKRSGTIYTEPLSFCAICLTFHARTNHGV